MFTCSSVCTVWAVNVVQSGWLPGESASEQQFHTELNGSVLPENKSSVVWSFGAQVLLLAEYVCMHMCTHILVRRYMGLCASKHCSG